MKTTRDDDYLVCHEYQKHIDQVSSVYPDFITFQHANGNFYFAWVYNKEIILRSEAYPDDEKMERGIKAIIKNRVLAERYKVENNHGAHFLCLMGGGDHSKHTGNMESHNEVGRSCPKKSRRELHDLLLSKGLPFADKVVPLSAEDMTVRAEPVTPPVVTPGVNPQKITTPIAAAMASKVIAETKKDISAAPVKAAGYKSTTSDTGGGFNWRWLLPLLLFPLFFLWKKCSNKEGATPAAEASIPTPAAPSLMDTMQAASTPVSADTMKKTSAAPASASTATPSCNLHWIHYDFNQASIRSDAKTELENMAKILKDNPGYVGEIKAYTDAKGSDDYNQKLSLSRAANAQAILTKLGIAANRIKTSASSEADPIATNTDDDSGRQFNRRSELYIKDKSGKEICKSIAPEVPGALKVK